MPEHPENPNTFTFAFASDHPDGNGNHPSLNGWDLDRFRRNPVVFFNHLSHLAPIGRASNLTVRGSQMFADIELAPSELGVELARLIADDFIIGASAGYLPTEWEFARNEQNRITGIRSTKQELREISIVGLPAQADTLKVALLAAGSPETITLEAMSDRLDLITGTVPLDVKVPETPNSTADESLAQIAATLATFNKHLRG